MSGMPAVCFMQACAALSETECGAGLCSARWHGAAWRMYKAACQRGAALRYATYQTLISFAFQACLCLSLSVTCQARGDMSGKWRAVAEERRAGCALHVSLSATYPDKSMPESHFGYVGPRWKWSSWFVA